MATQNRLNKIKQVANKRQNLIVVLEDVHDPHNAAAVMRSCDAFGAGEVHLIFEQEKRWNPKKVGKSTSSSANKWLDFKIYTSTKKCIADLHRRGYKVYATTLEKSAKSIFQTKFKGRVALVFGNEHRGLSDAALNLADQKMYIPMRGFVQSLNLSVTAGICLFEVTRQKPKIVSVKEQKS